jgi:hypothetical protein
MGDVLGKPEEYISKAVRMMLLKNIVMRLILSKLYLMLVKLIDNCKRF